MKKKIEKKSTTTRTIDQLSTAETIEHYNAVLIEDLTSQFKFVIENMAGVETRLTQKIEDLRKENQEEHDDIKFILHRHSEMFEEVDQRFGRLEMKVGGLEVKMTEVVDAVHHHEKDIQGLKMVV